MTKTYYGESAVRQVAFHYAYDLMPSHVIHLIKEEGYVTGTYKDDVGVTTYGVGQTGEWVGKNLFTDVLPYYESRCAFLVPQYSALPDAGKAAVLSAVYRGDLGPRTARLLADCKYEEAAIEYLNHNEYRERKEVNRNDGVVLRMERNARAFKELGETHR